jgi:hypothetical protein
LIRDLVLPLVLKKGSSPAELSRMNWLFEHQSVW